MREFCSKILFFEVIFLFAAFTALAQKLPNIQENSIRFPASLKVDGKALEWAGQLMAYNHATEVYYTIANNDNQLYLIVKAKNADVITKIIRGGLTFAVNPSGKRSEGNCPSITYPILGAKAGANLAYRKKAEITPDTIRNKLEADSLERDLNRRLNNSSKTIGIEGIKDIADSTISVYNEYGIRTAARFDNSGDYTYELSIALTHLGLSIAKPMHFSYHIKLNGIAPKNSSVQLSGKGMYILSYSAGGAVQVIGKNTPQNMQLSAVTDFWGEYTLTK